MLTLTVNGVEYPLPVQTDELQQALDELYDAGRLSELVDPHAHLTSVQGDWPTPPHTDWPRPRLGALYWPVVGLARYAFGCFLVDEYTLGRIRAGMIAADTNEAVVSFYDGPEDTPQALLDENGDPILGEAGVALLTEAEPARVATMRVLATRPLVRTTDAALTAVDSSTEAVDAWVVILVDDRYATLHKHGTLAYSSWSSLFSAGSVAVLDAVDSDYLTPSDRWTDARVSGRSQAWLLDVAALSVGSRIVKIPGESPCLQRPTASRAAALSVAHTILALDGRFVGGGPITDADVEPGFPDTAKVVLLGINESTPTIVTVTGVGYGWPTGTHVTHWADPATGDTTSPQRTALAEQWADDWEAWQRHQYDTTYSGFVAVPRSGFVWAVEWFHDAGRGYTKYHRAPHWYGYLLAPANTGPSTPSTYSFECGLDETEGTVSLDLTDVAFDGLYWDGELCALGIDYGCGLTLVGTQLQVDADQLAGPGLTTYADCALQINPGCGLAVDGPTDTVRLDLTDVVFDGLYWNDEYCVLGINFGCGLTLVGDELQVDTSQLAGDRAETGMVVRDNPDPDCDNLAFDDEPFSTTTETLVTDVTLSMVGGNLRLTKTRVTYTNHFNEQGVIINRTAGTPTTTNYDIDPCLLAECCDAVPPTATAAVTEDPPFGEAEVTTFNFTSITGGVTYLWDFGDGTTSTLQNPTHVFDSAGRYEVTLTVTDACGLTDEAVVWVYVHDTYCPCAYPTDTGQEPAERLLFTLSGGTDDFAGANGDWTLYYIGPFDEDNPIGQCAWAGDLGNGWTALATVISPEPTIRIVATDGTASVTWEATVTQWVCDDDGITIPMAITGSVGSGTTPSNNFDLGHLEGGGCELCSPPECCPNALEATLYAHFGGSLASYGTVALSNDFPFPSWSGNANGDCGNKSFVFACDQDTFNATFAGTSTDAWTGSVTDCDPFTWEGTTPSGGPGACGGEGTVTINITP